MAGGLSGAGWVEGPVRRGLAWVLAVALFTGVAIQGTAVGVTTFPPGASGSTPGGLWPNGSYETFVGWSNGNWADSDLSHYYTDVAGRFVVVTVDSPGLVVYTFDPASLRLVSTRRVSLSEFPEFGGFLAAPDGNLYVVAGRDNDDESVSATVVVVRKYSREWELLGEARVLGGASRQGIRRPFDAGVGRMALCGTTLVLHMSREMFTSPDGLNHQSNLTFSVDSTSMTARTFEDAYSTSPYVSHSFNQFVACRGSDLVLVDHGDAYPRGVVANVVRGFPPDGDGRLDERRVLWPLPGAIGDNYTGTTVTGLGLFDDGFLVVGNSVPHLNPVAGLTGSSESLPRNVYLIREGLTSGERAFTWLTSLTDADSGASEPRLVRLSDNLFAVLFTTTTGQKRTMQYRLIDTAGTVLASRSWSGRVFFPASDPILLGSRLIWAQRTDNPGDEQLSRGYLYSLDVTNPADPRVLTQPAALTVKAVSDRSKLNVNVDPNKGAGYWTFRVQKRTRTGTWRTLTTTYKTQGTGETRTLDLTKGTYRVVVKAKYGYRGTTSAPVNLRK